MGFSKWIESKKSCSHLKHCEEKIACFFGKTGHVTTASLEDQFVDQWDTSVCSNEESKRNERLNARQKVTK